MELLIGGFFIAMIAAVGVMAYLGMKATGAL